MVGGIHGTDFLMDETLEQFTKKRGGLQIPGKMLDQYHFQNSYKKYLTIEGKIGNLSPITQRKNLTEFKGPVSVYHNLLFNKIGPMLPFEHGKYYHIYPIADTYAWVLMKNHFHLLVRIREEEEISRYKFSNADRSIDAVRFQDEKWETLPNLTASAGFNLTASAGPVSVKTKRPNPTLHFSILFNAYTKAFNKRFSRHGALFERPFKRKLIHDETYLKQVVVYIHNNPVHHGISEHPVEYPWSSYLTCLSLKPTRLNRDAVIGWFDDAANFKYLHNKTLNTEMIETWPEL